MRYARNALLLIVIGAGLAVGEDWPSWRGPAGTGVSTEKSPPISWNGAEKQNICWRTPLPDRGNSTPIVCGNRVFVTQAIEKDQRRTVMCFSRSDGKLLWQSGITAKDREPTNTPESVLLRLARHRWRESDCIVWIGRLVLLRHGWQRTVASRIGPRRFVARQRFVASDLSRSVHFEFRSRHNAALVACNKRTGEIAWKVTPPKTPALPTVIGIRSHGSTIGTFGWHRLLPIPRPMIRRRTPKALPMPAWRPISAPPADMPARGARLSFFSKATTMN